MTINQQRLWLGVLLGGVLVSQAVVANDALQLLARMQTAVRDLNYSGQLVYSQGDELATYRIVHQAGEAQESVVRLDSSDKRANNKTESFSLVRFDPLYSTKEQSYAFDLGGDMRVADQPCRVVVARPKDKLRYLHRYCISPTTGMLLKYSLMDREQKVLEQLVFTQLTLDTAEVAPIDTANGAATKVMATTDEPVLALDAVAPVSARALSAAPAESSKTLVFDKWDFNALPAGFKVVKVVESTAESPAPQVILSDGMTAVSVFISPLTAPQTSLDVAYAAGGATHILSHEVAGHVLTFVGEVPLATLQAIQKGLSHVD